MELIDFDSLNKDEEPFRMFGIKVEQIITAIGTQSLNFTSLNIGFATVVQTTKPTNGPSHSTDLISSKTNKKRPTEKHN